MRDGTLEASLRRHLTLLAVFLLAVIIWFIPPPPGVQPRAWHLLAIFVATIVGIILKPLPMGAIAMIGVAATALSGTLTINQALSGFGNSTIWLIVVAFFISRGFIKTGLGSRIAYLFMAALGKRTLGPSYGLIATDLTWKDILKEEGAWDTLVWFAALVMMASFLNELGLIPWLTQHAQGLVGGVSWYIAFPVLCLIYFYSHYLFASQTAHVSAMYGAFLAVSVAVGTPALLAALVLGYASNLFSSLTHYGSGSAPVLFGSGYVELSTWWKFGALASVINILIWLIIGGLWWKVLGLW